MNSNRLASYEFLSSANPQDEYELIQRIGSGTYGEVYKARHIPTAAMRALKVIKLEPGDDFNVIQQEILMMIHCTHPNIISYFGSYLKRDKLWIAMELCSGGSMEDIYHVYGALNETQIAYILKETLKGLDYLHRNSKMHRDIKGANILLTDDGNVKLADFGVAASITATIGKRLSFIGTPYWMAPEVAAVERKGGYNHLCDIWAVGITGIEFAELQPPMFDLHPMRALFLMSKSNFKPPTLKDKNKWSSIFQNFLKCALTKNPKKRPSADCLLKHPFVQNNFTSHIARDLLDRLHNDTTNNNLAEDRDDEDDDRIIIPPPKKITSTKDTNVVSSSNIRPLVANLVQTPLIRSSVLDDDTNQTKLVSKNIDQNSANLEHIQRLQELGIPDRDIHRLMVQSPLKAFQNLSLNEIQHIIDVMREADVVNDDDDDEPATSTIKRAPTNNLDTNNNNTLKRTSSQSNSGIPSVPKVHMGAGFMKIFNQCPLEINSSTCWINNETKEQHILIATTEGIYALNLNEIHDTTLELLYPYRTTWLFTKDNILWSISGKSSSLYRHDLILLMQHKISGYSSLSSNKTQIQQKFEKLISKKLAISVKIENTRGCTRCTVGRNPFNGFIYLAGLLPNEIFLMQYYEPLRKFMTNKNVQISLGVPPKIFELIFSPENQYGYLCFGVSRSKSSTNSFKFARINFETEMAENCQDVTLLPNVSQIIQHENDTDTIFICQDNRVKLVNSLGKIRFNSSYLTELRFDYDIQSIICLQDSILAFHEHGMQGRNLKDNEITQEVHDETRTFRVICHDRMIVLQSRTLNSMLSDLQILMGHENT